MKTTDKSLIAITLVLLMVLFNIPIMNFAAIIPGEGGNAEYDGGPLVNKFNWSGSSYDVVTGEGVGTVTISSGSATSVTWSSTKPIYVIIVKGSNDYGVINLPGDYSGSFDNSMIPLNNGGQRPEISNLKFYTHEVTTTIPVVTTTTVPEVTTTTIPEVTTTTVPEVTTTTVPEVTTTTVPEVTTTTVPEVTTTTVPEVTTTTVPEVTTTTTIPEVTTTTTNNEEETTTTTTTTTTTREERERTTTTVEETTTTVEDITETTGPLDVPDLNVPEEIVPLALATLPKTGEIPVSLFYGLGGLMTALGLFIRRR